MGKCGGLARRALAAAVLFVLLPTIAAEASTRLCRQLEAQLAALPSGGAGGSSTQAKRYDAAIRRQQEQMRKAREQGQQAACGRAMFGRSVAFCGSLAATMQRMEKNLDELQRQRARMGGGSNNRRERARVMAAIDANGCRARNRDPLPGVETAAIPKRTVAATQGTIRIDPQRNLAGNFRTMCVRTCDGYYFPVSWSVSQAAFERDQNVCQAMCPGTQVELHVHRVTGEESEDMVSVATGLPYRDMPTAFRYRQPNAAVPQGCGCEASAMAERGFTVIGGDHGNGIVVQQKEDRGAITAALPHPSSRPDPAEDPETLASREGGLDAETLKRLATPARRPAASDGDRAVRVVGPTFLPDPEGAIDLQVQDQPRAR